MYCKEKEYYLLFGFIWRKRNNKVLFWKFLSEIAWIVEAAKQEASIRLLNDKVDEINFINNFQEILTSAEDKNNLIIPWVYWKNKFSIFYSLLITYEDDKPQVMYSNNKGSISEQNLIN